MMLAKLAKTTGDPFSMIRILFALLAAGLPGNVVALRSRESSA